MAIRMRQSDQRQEWVTTRLLLLVCALTSSCAVTYTQATSSASRTHAFVPSPATGWSLDTIASNALDLGDERICFQIAIQLDSSVQQSLEELLYNVSTPTRQLNHFHEYSVATHPMYGQYLSGDDLRHFLGDSVQQSQQLILNWLNENQLYELDTNQARFHPTATTTSEDSAAASTISSLPSSPSLHQVDHVRVASSGDFVDVCTSVARVEKLFQTKLHRFKHIDDEGEFESILSHEERSDRPTTPHSSSNLHPKHQLRAVRDLIIPTHLIEHIDFIGGINTPIHRSRARAILQSKRRHATKHYRDQADSPQQIDECKIPNAYQSLIAATSGIFESSASKGESDSNTAMIPRILELKAGNEQSYLKWQVACDSSTPPSASDTSSHIPFSDFSASSSQTQSCQQRIRAFHIVLQPIDSLKEALKHSSSNHAPSHIAATIPFPLANCQSQPPLNHASPTTECEAIFTIKNYVGYFVMLQVELQPFILPELMNEFTSFSPLPTSPPTFIRSCIRGPIFGHELVSTAFLQERYGIPPSMHTLRQPNNTIAIVEFMETYWNNRDLQTYLTLMNRPHDQADAEGNETAILFTDSDSHTDTTGTMTQPDTRHRLHGHAHHHQPALYGFNNDTEALFTGDEAQLDIQVVMGLLTSEMESETIQALDADLSSLATTAGSVSMWNIPGREPENTEEPFLRWVLTVQELVHPPLVYSISYGDLEDALPNYYLDRLNIEFLKMGLRGMTIIFPSGDKGVGSDFEPEEEACQQSRPEFPVSSPYVLAVGASQLSGSSRRSFCSRLHHHLSLCQTPTEIACSADAGGKITTGGGFSNHFKRPTYQRQAVGHYLNYHSHAIPKNESFFNAEGRAYPDISTYGTHFVTVNNGVIVPAAGTSASVPVMAAMVALLNDIRLSRGAPPLGFLPPFLYHLHAVHPHTFRDIVDGHNRCRLEEQTCCADGFEATRGWDAVSGLGTPRFDIIAEWIRQEPPFQPKTNISRWSNPSDGLSSIRIQRNQPLNAMEVNSRQPSHKHHQHFTMDDQTQEKGRPTSPVTVEVNWLSIILFCIMLLFLIVFIALFIRTVHRLDPASEALLPNYGPSH